MDERKEIIKELQKKAKAVLDLKQIHRQKKPIVIEFSGSPKAGKTSCINSLELFLKRNGFTVKIIRESAAVCPITDKQSPMFNMWTVCSTLTGVIETIENKECNYDVLIIDRGIFDALCWFKWLYNNNKMEKSQKEAIENFILLEDLTKYIDIVFAFSVQPKVSIDREYATLLTDKLGSIMNIKVLSDYLEAIEETIRDKSNFFHRIQKIETSDKNQDEVSKEVTSITLEILKDLLMEKIGYLDLTDMDKSKLLDKIVFLFNDIENLIPQIKFDLRENVEKNSKLLQPIPVAVITNYDKNKILVIKKNKYSTSKNSPERNKLLLYIGGHSRYEDSTEKNSQNFLSVCRSTLKRELKEEIGLSIALNDIEPFFIYTDSDDSSKKHLAVCFWVMIDENGVKLNLDSNELIIKRGKSKSGSFLKLDEICREKSLEDWSKIILKHCFNIDYNHNNQISFFDS